MVKDNYKRPRKGQHPMRHIYKYPASILACTTLLAGMTGTAAFGQHSAAVARAASAQPSWPTFPSFTKDVTITWWTFDDNPKNVVAAFNKVYPNIHVLTPLVGAGGAEYTKLLTVIKAGSGAPDLVQIEYPILPEFIATGGLLPITKYVGSYSKYFSPAVWNLVQSSGKVYALPENVGPLGFMYRPDIYKKYGLTPPKTYSQLAADAAKLHAANPKMYYTFLDLNGGWDITAYFWQAGAKLFSYQNGTWTVNINNSIDQKVLNFWGGLVKSGDVQATPTYTPQWESEVGNGLYASAIEAQWAPQYMIGPYTKPATSNWAVAPLPQWDPARPLSADVQSATDAVTTQSKNPAAAALFDAWIHTSQAGVLWEEETQGGAGVYSANLNYPEMPQFNIPISNLSGQHANPVWAQSQAEVDTNWQWSPWTTYYYSQLSAELAKAAAGNETWDQVLANVQNEVVTFAKEQGYQVRSS